MLELLVAAEVVKTVLRKLERTEHLTLLLQIYLSPYFKQQIYCPSWPMWRALQQITQGNNKFSQATGIQYFILVHKL
jgi:hypothetical protein